MQKLYLAHCLGLFKPDRTYHLVGSQMSDIYQQVFGSTPSQSQLDQMTQNATYNGKAVVDLSPAEYQSYLSGTPEGIQQTALKNANAAQQMQLAANQPAIQTLQTQYNPDTGTGSLVDKYNSLIDSITAAEQPAVDVAKQGVNAQLAARGIVSSNAGVGNDQLQQVINPLTTQFGQLKAQTGLSEQQDLGNLASQIAGLRAGNVQGALSFAGGLGAAQTAAQAGIQEAQTYGQAQVAAAKAQPFTTITPGDFTFNKQTGQLTSPNNLFSRTQLNNP